MAPETKVRDVAALANELPDPWRLEVLVAEKGYTAVPRVPEGAPAHVGTFRRELTELATAGHGTDQGAWQSRWWELFSFAAGECQPVRDLFGEQHPSARILQGMADAIGECGCEKVDVDLASMLVIAVFEPGPVQSTFVWPDADSLRGVDPESGTLQDLAATAFQ
jgi:hypothetical protein